MPDFPQKYDIESQTQSVPVKQNHQIPQNNVIQSSSNAFDQKR